MNSLIELDIDSFPERLHESLAQAEAVRQNAYSPYSGYSVGCALVGEDGKCYTGCNVENASYGAVICAERVAVVKMVSHGVRHWTDLVMVTGSSVPAFPCGECLQVLLEFQMNSKVYTVNGDRTRFREGLFSQLYPHGFGDKALRT